MIKACPFTDWYMVVVCDDGVFVFFDQGVMMVSKHVQLKNKHLAVVLDRLCLSIYCIS